MRDVILSRINPDMFSMINKYCKLAIIIIRRDKKNIGCLSSIAYLPRMSSDGTDQIRFNVTEEPRERRLFCRPLDRNGTDLTRYSISY